MSSPYKNFRHSSVEQTGNGMLHLLRTELYAQNFENGELSMSLVEKLNKSGNAYNERLLLLRSPGYLGYCREFEPSNKLPIHTEKDLPSIKSRVMLESIVEHWTDYDLLNLKFREEGNKYLITWCLRMSSPSLAYQWDNLIMDARTKSLEVHNKAEPYPERQSKRPSQLSMSVKIVQYQIAPTKKTELETMLDRSGGAVYPFQTTSQLSQIPINPMQSSNLNLAAMSPVENKTDHDDEIWVFAYFKEQKGKVMKSIKSTSSIQIVQPKPSSKDNSLIEEESMTKYLEAEQELNRMLKVDWFYEFLQSDETELVPLFERFSSRLVMRLVDQMILPTNMQVHRPRVKDNDFLEYSLEHIVVGLAFPIATSQGNYSENAKHRLRNEFNNLNYLIQHAGNEGMLRLPLACLIDYKGNVALVTTIVRTLKTEVSFSSIRSQLADLSARTKINSEVFYDSNSLLISQVDTEYYNREARQKNEQLVKAPLYVLTDVHSFLPKDLFFGVGEEHQMRPYFVQSVKLPIDGRKLYKLNSAAQQVQITYLEEVSTKIIDQIDEVTEELNKYPCPVVLPSDLRYIMHRKGVASRYLGMLYETLYSAELKKLVMSDIIAKSLSTIIKGRLCSQNLTQSSSSSKQLKSSKLIEVRNSDLVGKLIDLIKRLLCEDSEYIREMWEEVDRTALFNHHKSIDRSYVLPQYFYIALLERCCLKIRWELFQKEFKFEAATRTRLFDGFDVRTESYQLSFLDKAKEVRKALARPESLSELRKVIGIDEKGRLYWLKRADLHHDVVRYHMANESFEDSLLDVEEGKLFGFFELNFLLAKVRYSLSTRNPKSADNTGDQLHREIYRCYSENHPFVSMVLYSYSDYHEKATRFEEALLLAKNSLLIKIKFAGSNSKSHLHVESYQRIANLLTKLKRHSEAIDYYKSIRQSVKRRTNRWADTIMKEAELYRAMGKLELVEGDLYECYTWLRECDPIDEKRLTQVIDLMVSGTSELQPTKAGSLILQLQQLCVDIEEPEYLEPIFRHIIRYHYSKIPRSSTESFLELMKELVERYAGNYNYGYSVNIIKKRLSANKMWNNLKEYLSSLDKLLPYISQQRVLETWKGFKLAPADVFEDFLVIASTVLYFLGPEFISSVLYSHKL